MFRPTETKKAMQNLVALWDILKVHDTGSGGYIMYGWNIMRIFKGGGEIKTELEFIQNESVRDALG